MYNVRQQSIASCASHHTLSLHTFVDDTASFLCKQENAPKPTRRLQQNKLLYTYANIRACVHLHQHLNFNKLFICCRYGAAEFFKIISSFILSRREDERISLRYVTVAKRVTLTLTWKTYCKKK